MLVKHPDMNIQRSKVPTGNGLKRLQYKRYKTPLKKGNKTQPTFRGVSVKGLARSTKELFLTSETMLADDIVKEIRKHVPQGINYGVDELAKEFAGKNKRLTVAKPVWETFGDALLRLPRAIHRGWKKLAGGKAAREAFKEQEALVKQEDNLIGHLLKVRQLGRKYDEEFSRKVVDATSVDKTAYIQTKLNEDVQKKMGSFLSEYDQASAQTVARAGSGVGTALFVANDFRNMKIQATNDENEAGKEWRKRFIQHGSNIGMSLYLGDLLNSTFIRATNRSLPFTVALASANSVASNILSRVINKVPILPVKSKNPDTKPYVIEAQQIRNKPYASPLKTYQSFKGRDNQVAFSGNPFRWVGRKLLQATADINDFKGGYQYLINRNTDSTNEQAAKMLEIAGKSMGLGEKANLAQITAAAVNGKVKIGPNSIHRVGEAIIEAVKFPVDFVVGLGRRALNLGRRALKMEPIEGPKEKKFYESRFIQNVIKWTKEGKLEEKVKGFYDQNVMDYSSTELGNAVKLTGFITVPFLFNDAYNETMKTTNNVNISKEEARQRGIQDTARQGFSFWVVKSFNEMFKGLINGSLTGNMAGVLMNTVAYETITRAATGQPILPKSHEQMKEIEKKNLKNQSWLIKALGGKVRSHEDKVIVGSKKLRPTPFASNLKYDEFIINRKKNLV